MKLSGIRNEQQVRKSPSFTSIKVIVGAEAKVSKYIERLDKINLHATSGGQTILLDGEHMADFLKSKYDFILPEGIQKAKNTKELQKFAQKNPNVVLDLESKMQKVVRNLNEFISNVFNYAKTKQESGEKIEKIGL